MNVLTSKHFVVSEPRVSRYGKVLEIQLRQGVRTVRLNIDEMMFENILSICRLQFPSLPLCMLPREATLTMKLYGLRLVPPEGRNEVEKQVRDLLGWVSLNLFDIDK